MVDTGAAPNLVKQCRIDPKIHINPDSKIILSGITDGQIETLGTIDIEYLGFGIRLHVVNNKFPISQDGILGSEFLRDASCINFSENCVIWQGLRVPFDYGQENITIPARTRTVIPLRVSNPDINEGYIPRIHVHEDVYLGDAVVTNRDGIAYAGIINSSEKARTIAIPTVELLEVEKFFSEDTNLENNKNNKVFAATAISHTDKREKTQIINNLLRLSHLNEEESSHVSRLIDRHQDLFHLPGSKLGFTSVIKHKIATSDEQPINTKQYRFPPVHKEEIEKQIKELLENDVIKPSESPYNSPLWIVPKKADSKGNKRWRMVIDYRALNEKTIGDAYPLPNITEILDQLGSAKYFSVFDLASGFHQIPMHESHAGKTAFSTPHGHYEFNRMPFGLKNAPATFQRLMDQVLSGLQGNELFVYLDDIVLYASSLKEHEVKFNKLAERLKKANLKLQPDKCEFLRKEPEKINANADALSRNPIHILPTAAEEGENARVLPIEGKIVSDSEESLFNCTPKPAQVDRQNHSSNSADEAPQTPSDESDESGYTETDSSSSDSDSYIFDNPNETAATKNLTGPRIIEIPDNFATRRDNLVVFITQQGAPIDTGARMLQETQSLPLIRDAALARAKVNKSGSKYIISLVIKERLSEITERIIVKEALRSLLDVVTELGLQSISIAKGNVDNVPWEVIHSLLTRILDKTNLKIFTCSNKITIPPNEDRLRILEENHCSAIGGHKGITKTFNRVKKRYNWAGMKADIQSFIRNCRSCQLKKLVRVKTKQPMVLTDTPDSAFDKVSMDIMGPLPTTRSGNNYILTIQDLLTKYSLALPLKHAGAIDVADAFTNEFICTFGAPKAILTDQARKFKIRHFRTTAYRPQSNGSVERSHQVLWEYLKHYVDKTNEWDTYLRLASFSYNTSVHEGTQFTPHELVFGKTARVPSSETDTTQEPNESYAKYLVELFNKIKDAQTIARENLNNAKKRSKLYYDRKLNTRKFKVGTNVYLLREPTKGKLGDQYIGPYKITEILGNNNVKIAISRHKTRIVHADKLKFSPHQAPTLITTPPQSSSSQQL
ncbi:hypothetical protein ACFW04_012557 [Cataglyphis niger]